MFFIYRLIIVVLVVVLYEVPSTAQFIERVESLAVHVMVPSRSSSPVATTIHDELFAHENRQEEVIVIEHQEAHVTRPSHSIDNQVSITSDVSIASDPGSIRLNLASASILRRRDKEKKAADQKKMLAQLYNIAAQERDNDTTLRDQDASAEQSVDYSDTWRYASSHYDFFWHQQDSAPSPSDYGAPIIRSIASDGMYDTTQENNAYMKDLLRIYTDMLNVSAQIDPSQIESISSNPRSVNAYTARLLKRKEALELVQSSSSSSCRQRNQVTDAQVRGFMMAHEMNYIIFETPMSNQFQDCLSQEGLDIINAAAQMSYHRQSDTIVQQFAVHTCKLAVAAQELNCAGRIKEAVVVTDCNHMFSLYGASLIADDGDAEAQVIGAMGKGVGRVIEKWTQFGAQLYATPAETIAQVAAQCKQMGTGMLNVLKAVNECMPTAYYHDLIGTMQQRIDYIDNQEQQRIMGFRRSGMQDRTHRTISAAKTMVHHTFEEMETAIVQMMERTVQENITDITEHSLDYLITKKATALVTDMCAHVGNHALTFAAELYENIPDRMLDDPLRFAHHNGQFIAAVPIAGTSSYEPVVAMGNGFAPVQQFFAMSKVGKHGGGKSGNAPVVQPEPKYGTPEWSKKYPNGKYVASAKHHQNSFGSISKPPRDGQAALDRSFAVKGSTQRVTTQDKKIIILKFEGNGIYHGYIVEDFFSINLELSKSKNMYSRKNSSRFF